MFPAIRANSKRKIMKTTQRSRIKNKTYYQVVEEIENDTDSDNDSLEFDEIDGVTTYAGYHKVYMFGEKITGFKTVGLPQDYAKLRQQHIQNKTLFNDSNFPPTPKILTDLKQNVVWKRPFELVDQPHFIKDGATRFDIDQGLVGDCWFLAAIANLTINQNLFSIVVPMDQSFTENYAGIFHFRFWQFGRWVDVVIDDRLPTVNNKLVYLKSPDSCEFWPSLLEKAYAKFYGSYKNLEGGQITEALEDLCGGLSEFYEANHSQIYQIMEMSFRRSSFIGTSIVSTETEGKRSDGLITTHAYSVTDVKTVSFGDYDKKLIRLRNPWGNSVEWNGEWSDHSESWNLVPIETRRNLLSQKPDGEFWIEVEDFKKCFTFVDICHPNPSSFFYSEGDNKNWDVHMFEGSWMPHATAGGSFENTETFSNNPQYHLTIRENKVAKYAAVIIGLMQKDRRIYGANELPLELNVFRVKTHAGAILDKTFFKPTNRILHKRENGVRQLTVRVMLPPGKYCIVPSVVEPNVFGSYLLRIYSNVHVRTVENDEDIGYSSDAILNQSSQEMRVNNNSALFRTLAGNESEIGWNKVQKALNKLYADNKIFCFMKPKISFSKNTCKQIVALWDQNCSGRIDNQEFVQLVNDIASLRNIFKKYDDENNGKLDGFKLRTLLTDCGYKVDKKILMIIMLRYGYNGFISFENFVVCTFKLRTMIDEFNRRRSIDASDQINVSQRDWLQTTLYS